MDSAVKRFKMSEKLFSFHQCHVLKYCASFIGEPSVILNSIIFCPGSNIYFWLSFLPAIVSQVFTVVLSLTI